MQGSRPSADGTSARATHPGGPGHLVVGEVVADVVRPPGREATVHPGGSPGNVAYGLARLGRTAHLLTELADDEHGALIAAHLASAGVHVTAVVPSGGRTAAATAVLDPTGAATYTFDITWSLQEVPALPPFHHFHTGSIAAFLAPGADVLARMVRQARTEATVSFDPNIRPALLPHGGDALERVRRILEVVDVVKASDEDLAWLHPEEDPQAVARDWLARGPALVVVTLGAGGALALTRSGAVTVPASPVTVVDTVGAGDSFMSALLDGLDGEGLLGAGSREALRAVPLTTVERVLRRAARAAGLTVSRAGAHPPAADELDAAEAAGAIVGPAPALG